VDSSDINFGCATEVYSINPKSLPNHNSSAVYAALEMLTFHHILLYLILLKYLFLNQLLNHL